MRGVRPLAPGPGRVPTAPARGSARPRPPRLTPSLGAAAQTPSGPALLQVEAWGESVQALAAGVPRERLKALGRGEVRPELTLDLHGVDVAGGRARLNSFITAALAAGRRCVGVIHGRGLRSGPEGPVLRQMVIEALSRPPLGHHVLALSHAPAALGGPGCTLVLLRR